LVRRSRGSAAQPALQCGSLVRAHGSRSFTLDGELRSLTPRESAALSVLLARAGTPVEKAQLSHKVFPAASNAGPDAIELVLHRLRRKLAGADVRIVTVRGLGYMLESVKHGHAGAA
ncbi:MAG TPA: winged helix-turn-helix domain-containing protein, partial [Ramlibacter sp.]